MKGKDKKERREILRELRRLWESAALQFQFSDFEAALVKSGIEYSRKRQRRKSD